MLLCALVLVLCSIVGAQDPGSALAREDLVLIEEISGNLNPQEIICSEEGLFFVPNSRTHHSISVFDRTFQKVQEIDDEVFLSDYLFAEYKGAYQGDPINGALTPDGEYLWIANFRLFGEGLQQSGYGRCNSPGIYAPSFLYKIHTETYRIESVIEVGSAPKYLAISPNGKYVVVSHWCSGDVSVIDTEIEVEKFRIDLGEHPSGIAISSNSATAFLGLYGEDQVVAIDLIRERMSRFTFWGRTPDRLLLGPSDDFLYVSFLREGKIGKVDIQKRKLLQKVETGKVPVDMAMTPDGRYLYVIHEKSLSLVKLRTEDMSRVQQIFLAFPPVGLDFDPLTSQLWVAHQEGIWIFQDQHFKPVNTFSTNPFLSREIGGDDFSPEREEEAPQILPLEEKEGETLQIDEEGKVYPQSENIKLLRFHIIIASYSSEYAAEQKLEEIRQKGYTQSRIIATPEGYFRISCVSYLDIAKAQSALSLIQENLQPEAWIMED